MDLELTGLEQKLAALLADYDRLREESASLRSELSRAHERNAALTARMQNATARLDRLIEALPQESS
jgi:chromosome segregation ATPase